MKGSDIQTLPQVGRRDWLLRQEATRTDRIQCWHATVHNVDLSAVQVNQLMNRIRAEVQIAIAGPDHMTVLVMGDLNYHEGAPTHLHVPLIDQGVSTDPRSREHGDLFSQGVEDVIELDQERPTHSVKDGQKLTP
eukprot:5644179-Pyramimonas_sp.AAC.1